MRLSGEAGRECQTAAGLDHQDTRDYATGNEVRTYIRDLRNYLLHTLSQKPPYVASSVVDFAPQLVFDGSPDSGLSDGLTACYMADLGGAVTGGSVTWLGEGALATRSSS